MSTIKKIQSKRFQGYEELELALNDIKLIGEGNAGDFVKVIQKALIDFGFPMEYGADGIFGPKTKESVKQFQRSKKIADDGIIGPDTMGQLDKQALEEENREKDDKEKKNLQTSWEIIQNAIKHAGKSDKHARQALCLFGLYGAYRKGEFVEYGYLARDNAHKYIKNDRGNKESSTFMDVSEALTQLFERLDLLIKQTPKIFASEIIKEAGYVSDGLGYIRARPRYASKNPITAKYLDDYITKRMQSKNDIYHCFKNLEKR